MLQKNIQGEEPKLQDIKLGQQAEKIEADEIHFNDLRDLWALDGSSLSCIEKITNKFIGFINSNENSVPVIPKLHVPPEYMFLIQFKEYLSFNIQEHLNSKEAKNL